MPAPKGNQNAVGNKGGGRPSTYEPKFAKIAAKLCELGATDADLAEALGVGSTTIRQWAAAHVEFSAALKIGKGVVDDRVERSLLHRALGYTYDAVKIFMPAGASEPVHAPYRHHVPPDTTACIFWLKNRRSQQWRDVHKHEIGEPGDFDRMDDKALRKEIETEAKELGIDLNGPTQH
jgi:hypothetical protein